MLDNDLIEKMVKNERKKEKYLISKTIRLDNDLIEKMEKYCNERNISKTSFIRTIIDYACNEIVSNEAFREIILVLPKQREESGSRSKRTYRMPNELIKKLETIQNEYRIYNVNAMINETIKMFFN